MGIAKRPAELAAERTVKKSRKTDRLEASVSDKACKEDEKLTIEEAKEYFEANAIKIHVPNGKDVDISPLRGFQLSGFSKKLTRYCNAKFTAPTAIQACCWPIMMQRSDMCGIAKTGSGKTLAFALPYLSLSAKGQLTVFEQPCNCPRFLAMAPTRELAMQIHAVCKEISFVFDSGKLFPAQCVFGSVPKREQRELLENEGVDMLIATPGRLLDFANDGTVDLSSVQYLVLDEADRMLDMGFIDVVKNLISLMPKAGERQTCMFSATWPASVHQLATQFLASPVHVGIGSVDDGLIANTSIRQEVEVLVNEKDKPTRLLQCLKKHYEPGKKIIIFGLYKKETAWLETYLREHGYDKSVALQGDMTQEKRTKALDDFKSSKLTPLIATDVASRGLDVKDVQLVINYTFPLTIEDYVHRIGRTGRAGKSGLAICFFCPESKGVQDEKTHAGDLVKVLRDAKQQVPEALEKISNTSGGNKATKKKAHPLFGSHFKSADQMAALEAKKVHTTFEDSDDE
jgi:ATP-dependent RNA helicase DBP3|eukprot:TRINITY_DN15324_c0_g1_i1.p1 TRINITY_DN15324_c0_g1~~TRINITY_DN15324_c0_g1_i1.p1  ORF type:complete len:515 (+),score=110.02 TRINITY_DN15324_c0_g1_i1:74-1618(+)